VRTFVAIGIGLILLIVVAVLAARRDQEARQKAFAAYGAVWFVLCVLDAVVGVIAGYSIGEELLIHMVIFVVPAMAAFLVARRNPAHPRL
jgi:predicted Co/Zn/Cd cation transporter (cation efflux family)